MLLQQCLEKWFLWDIEGKQKNKLFEYLSTDYEPAITVALTQGRYYSIVSMGKTG